MFFKVFLLICCAVSCHGEEEKSILQLITDFFWGPEGYVDYRQINSTIDEKMKPVINRVCNLEKTMEEKMESLISELVETLPTLMLKKQGLCEIEYNNSCFWAVVHGEQDLTYSEAEAFCNVRGGWVADIYDEQHYDDVYSYLGNKITYLHEYHDFWLGMTYDPEEKSATTRDGGEAYVRWYPGYPSSAASHRRVYLGVHLDPYSEDSGMINHPIAPGSLNGVLCEIQK